MTAVTLDELGQQYNAAMKKSAEGLADAARILKTAKERIEFDHDPKYPDFLSWLEKHTNKKKTDYANRLIRTIAEADDPVKAAENHLAQNRENVKASNERAADLRRPSTVQKIDKQAREQRDLIPEERRIEIIRLWMDGLGVRPAALFEAYLRTLTPEEQQDEITALQERLRPRALPPPNEALKAA